MLRRRPIARAAVGTAVVAGTATAVSGRVQRRQEARYAAAAPQPAAVAQPAPAPAPGAPPAEAGPGRDVAAQLKDLATLKEQGVLTDDEFEAEKQRILAGR